MNIPENKNKFIKNRDVIRRKIFNYLKNNNLTINKKKCLEFYNFITEDQQEEFFIQYIHILLGDFNEEKSFKLLNKIIEIYKKRTNIYTFKELFILDPEWYEFYCINANQSGDLINNEKRKGVDKKYVNDIIIIKNMINRHLIESIKLEDCMIIYQNIKNKINNF